MPDLDVFSGLNGKTEKRTRQDEQIPPLVSNSQSSATILVLYNTLTSGKSKGNIRIFEQGTYRNKIESESWNKIDIVESNIRTQTDSSNEVRLTERSIRQINRLSNM